MDSSNASDQIAFCAFHSFLLEVQTKVYMRRMRNNNLEIRIAGSGLLSPAILSPRKNRDKNKTKW